MEAVAKHLMKGCFSPTRAVPQRSRLIAVDAFQNVRKTGSRGQLSAAAGTNGDDRANLMDSSVVYHSRLI
jgi:hypothetical protein